MWSREDVCDRCWGQEYVTVYEDVPYSELSDAQIAETMVNGGTYRRSYRKPCPSCSSPTKS